MKDSQLREFADRELRREEKERQKTLKKQDRRRKCQENKQRLKSARKLMEAWKDHFPISSSSFYYEMKVILKKN